MPWSLILLSVLVASVSMTVSRALIFKSLRQLVQRQWPWAASLLTCPYCTAHWVALSVCLIRSIHPAWTFVLVGLAVPFMIVIELFFRLLESSHEEGDPVHGPGGD